MVDKQKPNLIPNISLDTRDLKPRQRSAAGSQDLYPKVYAAGSLKTDQLKEAIEDDLRFRTSRFEQAIERIRVALKIARKMSNPDFIDKAIEEIRRQGVKAVQCDGQHRTFEQILEFVGTSSQELNHLPDLFYSTIRVVPSGRGWEPRALKKKGRIVDLEEDVLEIRDKPPVQIVYAHPCNEPCSVKILYRKNDLYGEPYIRFLDDAHQQEVEIDGVLHQVMKQGMTAKMTRLKDWNRGWIYYPCASDGRFNPKLPWFGSCRTGLLAEPTVVSHHEVAKEVLVRSFIEAAQKN